MDNNNNNNAPSTSLQHQQQGEQQQQQQLPQQPQPQLQSQSQRKTNNQRTHLRPLPTAYKIQLHLRKGEPLERRRLTHGLPDPDPYPHVRDQDSYVILRERISAHVARHPDLFWPEDGIPYIKPAESVPQKYYQQMTVENFEEQMAKAWRMEAKRLGDEELIVLNIFVYLKEREPKEPGPPGRPPGRSAAEVAAASVSGAVADGGAIARSPGAPRGPRMRPRLVDGTAGAEAGGAGTVDQEEDRDLYDGGQVVHQVVRLFVRLRLHHRLTAIPPIHPPPVPIDRDHDMEDVNNSDNNLDNPMQDEFDQPRLEELPPQRTYEFYAPSSPSPPPAIAASSPSSAASSSASIHTYPNRPHTLGPQPQHQAQTAQAGQAGGGDDGDFKLINVKINGLVVPIMFDVKSLREAIFS
ncbi:hypothetical protein EC957_011058 [Mortierella hygrophila]|uniref:Uncharacterized protein n=1 Tax=Mortierella hygrophila TaxID=979708 RepID=A0A9P6F929_9FUNG|nr:hypothetical protein EC957_011058 [Mortierella hygrophila]